jgi:hypothetical protein
MRYDRLLRRQDIDRIVQMQNLTMTVLM